MPSLDIWFDVYVGQRDYAGAHHLVSAHCKGNRVNLSTVEPLTRITFPAVRSELHALLDEAIDRIQSEQPEGVPYVK